MRQYFSILLFFIGLLISSSFQPSNPLLTQQVQSLETKADSLSRLVSSLKCDVQSKELEIDYLSNPYNALERVYADEKKLRRKILEEKRIPGTDFYLDSLKYYNVAMDKSLYAALVHCDGPPVTLTSIRRNYNPRSHHYHGKAIDIRLDNQGMNFANWLVTPEGKAWRDNFDVKFYVEDAHHSSVLKTTFALHSALWQHKLINEKASGPHLHVEIGKKIHKRKDSKRQYKTT